MVFKILLASSVKHSNGNARCAVRLGIGGVTYSDSHDGFRICLGRVLTR